MSLKKNVVANYVGQGWAAVMGIAFVPLYVKALGAETFGLIGVFAILQAWMTLLDLGLTPTLNREMALLRAGLRMSNYIRDLLRSLEAIFGVVALMMIAAVCALAPWLARGWLRADTLSPELVTDSLRLMSFVLATRWLEQIYRGALQGLQDQVWLNTAQALLATLRWAGAYVLVAFICPSIIAFFLWQGAVSILTSVVLVRRTYSLLPAGTRRGQFNLSVLRDVGGFAGGMFVGAWLSFVLTQADKLAISKLLPLDQLGYYMVASAVASGLLQLVTPLNTAVLPRLTELIANEDSSGLAQTYQRACEWMSAVVIPIGLALTFFAEPMLLAWTGDVALVATVAPMLALLALGTLFNALMNIPYMLQLAHGWTGLSIQINLVAVLLIVPMNIYLVPRYGPIGAAAGWLALNAGYLLVGAHLMHRRLLPTGKWPWYRAAIGPPLVAGALVGITLKLILPQVHERLMAAAVVCAATACLFAAVLASLPAVRHQLMIFATASIRRQPR
jgi:O-antigen/teichoic acid export membrane protein